MKIRTVLAPSPPSKRTSYMETPKAEDMMFHPRGHLEENCPETTMMATTATSGHMPLADNKRSLMIRNASPPHFHLDVNATTETKKCILMIYLNVVRRRESQIP